MGQESSTPVDESVPPETLASRDLDGLAKFIKSDKCRKIVVMSGAGISTSAGIPDFRSPETGLYANLARLNLPYAEAVFDISYFRQNPKPFYILANELYPGKYRPTITHSFISLLHSKKLLLKHFTQNIDCLDREAGVPGSHIVEAHGSFADQSCIECGAPYPREEMLKNVQEKSVPECLNSGCFGLVKPKIVFFGEALPSEFFANRGLPGDADLAIIMGTSLTVQPFATLPSIVSDGVPRVLINLERVGGLGSRPDDVLLLGDCDEGVRKLAAACGWLDELEDMWEKTKPASEQKPAVAEPAQKAQSAAVEDKDAALEKQIAALTKEVDEHLKVSADHEQKIMRDPAMAEKIKEHLEGNPELKQADVAETRKETAGVTTKDAAKDAESEPELKNVSPKVDDKSDGKL